MIVICKKWIFIALEELCFPSLLTHSTHLGFLKSLNQNELESWVGKRSEYRIFFKLFSCLTAWVYLDQKALSATKVHKNPYKSGDAISDFNNLSVVVLSLTITTNISVRTLFLACEKSRCPKCRFCFSFHKDDFPKSYCIDILFTIKMGVAIA